MKPQKPDTGGRRRRKRIEPRELLRRRGVIFGGEVLEWLRDGRLYVYRDERGEPVAFYASEELMEEQPWWVEDQRMEEWRRGGPGGAAEASRQAGRLVRGA